MPDNFKRIASNEPNDYYHKLITKIYKRAGSWLFDGKLHPIVHSKKSGDIRNINYYIGTNADVFKVDGNIKAPPSTILQLNIDWSKTFDSVVQYMEDMYGFLNENGEDTNQFTPEQIKENNDIIKNIVDIFTKFNIRVGRDVDPQSEIAWATSLPSMDQDEIKLEGRGLRGAGRAVLNLGRVGTGAMDYKPIGTKYIRLPDLHKNVLNLKQPNRTSIGRKAEISPALTELIKELVYDNELNQSKYNHLSIKDKNIFTDILRITHLQYQFKSPWKDPRDSLKAEFDKLRGELLLGNNNAHLIKELKALSIDMYSQKLLSDEQFREILSLI
jgi:hypothetical protein